MDDFRRLNDESRAELQALAEGLSEAELRLPVEAGWTIGTVFAHLAFWDRLLEVRWQRALAGGIVVAHDAALSSDLLNRALDPLVTGVEPRHAVRAALEAGASVDRALAALPDEAGRAAAIDGLRWSFDRSIHRREHVAQIRARLGLS